MKPATKYSSVVLIALFAVIGCLCASRAEAGQFGPGRPFSTTELIAVAQAEAYWGRQPEFCATRNLEVVAPGVLGVDEFGRDVAARATQTQDQPADCGMWVEEDVLGPDLCSVVRHEYGHWLGFGHEDPELAQMPGCVSGSTSPSGGVYAPPDRSATARRQAWIYWREWRRECAEARDPYRPKCWRQLRRQAARLKARFD